MHKFFSFILLASLGRASAINPCEGLNLQFVNDYRGCDRYFSCVQGVAHPFACEPGRWFNANPLGCFLANQFPCVNCPSEGVHFYGKESSCSDYRVCINGVAVDRECAPTTLFDRRKNRCVPQEDAECEYLRCPLTGTKIVADPSNCSRYIVCIEGEEVAQRDCSTGLLFDPALGDCARADTVHCPLLNRGNWTLQWINNLNISTFILKVRHQFRQIL